MNYGHVCVSLLWIGSVMCCSGGILYSVYLTDTEFGRADFRRIRKLWVIYSLMVGILSIRIMEMDDAVAWLAYGLLAVYLIVSSVMDGILKMVCNFFHYIGLLGGSLLLWRSPPSPEIVGVLFLFVGIQCVVFCKMYGPADGAAFMVCAVYLAAEGGGMQSYLLHMAATFLLLGMVQGCKRNISRRGNLKHPVALFPYITAGFFIII